MTLRDNHDASIKQRAELRKWDHLVAQQPRFSELELKLALNAPPNPVGWRMAFAARRSPHCRTEPPLHGNLRRRCDEGQPPCNGGNLAMNAPLQNIDLRVEAEMTTHALLSAIDRLEHLARISPAAVKSTGYYLIEAHDRLALLTRENRQ